MPVVEIVRFSSSDDFVNKPSVLKPTLEFLKKIDGMISTYYGIQFEDKRTGYLFTIWETYEHHVKLTEDATYLDLNEAFKPASTSILDMQHVEFHGDFAGALGAPTSELVFWTPKEGVSNDEFLSAFKVLVKELAEEKTCHSAIWGESKERLGTLVILLGWDTVQARVDAACRGAFPEILKRLRTLANADLKHMCLVKGSD